MAYSQIKLKGFKFFGLVITTQQNVADFEHAIRTEDASICDKRVKETHASAVSTIREYLSDAIGELADAWRVRSSDSFRTLSPKDRRLVTQRVSKALDDLVVRYAKFI